MTEELPPEPPSYSSGVTPEQLARALGMGLPAPGATLDRLELALATAEDVVGTHTGRRADADWPTPFPPGPRVAVLQLAVRVYRASDVTFGVLQTELGSSFTGRWVTPEVALALYGWRRTFGVA